MTSSCRAAGSRRVQQERSYSVTVAGTERWFRVHEGERILGAARRAGVWLPFECGWGSCGTCKVAVVEGEVESLFPDAPAISLRDGRRRRVLACQTTAVSDLVVRATWVNDEPRSEWPTADYIGELVHVEELGPEIRRFRFDLDTSADYLEGQHAIVEMAPGLRRCYSMANTSGAPSVEFIAKRYAGKVGTEQLFRLYPGHRVRIELPYGEMWISRGDRPVALIAGGTGIAPILAMLRKLASTGDTRPVEVFYGAGGRDELVCWDELKSLVGSLPCGRLQGALVEPCVDWPGSVGFVTDALRERREQLVDSEFLLAGPPPMVDATLDLLGEWDTALDRIHFDRFG